MVRPAAALTGRGTAHAGTPSARSLLENSTDFARFYNMVVSCWLVISRTDPSTPINFSGDIFRPQEKPRVFNVL